MLLLMYVSAMNQQVFKSTNYTTLQLSKFYFHIHHYDFHQDI